MPSYAGADPSSSDDDTPETVTLTQSKKSVRDRDDALKTFQAAEKEKKKAQNRDRDRKLKEQSLRREGKKRGDGEEDGVEARMERAMREAQDEMDDDDEANFDGEVTEERESGESEDEDEDEDEAMDSDENGADDAESLAPVSSSKAAKSNPHYLPDHLFTSAFTSQSSGPSTSQQNAQKAKSSTKPPKKRRSGKTAKDLVIGTRAVRTLSNDEQPELLAAKRTKPPRTVTNFVKRSLNMRGAKSATKSWQRKPANIGVLKRSGPPSHFVRNR